MKLQGFAAFAGLLSIHGFRAADKGLNLPPTQGRTLDGAFYQGVYKYDYLPKQVAWEVGQAGFTAVRLAVNVASANDSEALKRHKAYIDAMGGHGIICMFDTTSSPNGSWPRTGRATDRINEMAQAWRNVHMVFGSYGDDVMYELFNEPWGYKGDATGYVADMTNIMNLAGLPANRSILPGLYGSADVQSIARTGWPGYLAYHVYSFWLPDGERTREKFSARIQADLAGLSSRVYITEFGVGLDGLVVDSNEDEVQQDVMRYPSTGTFTSDWGSERPTVTIPSLKLICASHPENRWCAKRTHKGLFAQEPNIGADVLAHVNGGVGDVVNVGQALHQNETMAFLRGLRDALRVLKKDGHGIRGLYHWHGWHNGDTWDFWDAANARSSHMIQMIMSDIAEADPSKNTDDDPFLDVDYVNDEQQVHMMVVPHLATAPSSSCPAECGARSCQPGNQNQKTGRDLTGNICAHNCSRLFSGVRYCGVGGDYQGVDAIDCSSCAHPAMCSGLPCWSDKPAKASTAQIIRHGFLQKRKP